MSKRRVVTMLSKNAWEAPEKVREDLLLWMEVQGDYSKQDRKIEKYLGDGIFLEDELDIEKIRADSPQNNYKLQQIFRNKLKKFQSELTVSKNWDPEKALWSLHQLILRFDKLIEEEIGCPTGPNNLSRKLLNGFCTKKQLLILKASSKKLIRLKIQLLETSSGGKGRPLQWSSSQTIIRVRKSIKHNFSPFS